MAKYIYSRDGQTAEGGLRISLPAALEGADKTTRTAAGWYDYISTAPTGGGEGETVVCVGYTRLGDDFTGVYKVVQMSSGDDDTHRTISKLKLYVALAQANLWESLVTWLKAQTYNGVNAYTAFTFANELRDDHPLFNSWFSAAKVALGVSDADAESILAECEVEG